MYLEIVFNLPLDKAFTYLKPKEIKESLVGCRVVATIKGRGYKGVVVKEPTTLDGDFTPLNIKSRIDNEPVCGEIEFEIAKWMSNYYHASFGECLFACIPAGTPAKTDKKVKPIYITQKPYLELNSEQESVLKTIKKNIDEKKYKSFLLNGVTGSGKTEIYLQAIKYVVELGKQAIVILPEISLTPQTIKLFAERFEGKIAILHSKLSPNQKYRYWQMIIKGQIQIVVGARSAIFSPTKNLGIIVIDEEHEATYKSNDTPRYHARQIAFFRAEKTNSTLILGSATPSVESFYYAKNNKSNISLLSLTKRAAAINMPEVTVIDMKKAKRSNIFNMMSEDLILEINKTLDKKEQVLLFLNRKGYSPVVSCSHCGYVLECPNCSVTLTYHKKKNVIMCHYCGYTQFIKDKCDKCNIGIMERIGSGTEKVEENIKILFQDKVIQRVDQESMNTVKSYENIFKSFQKGEIDILIGTQMIAKGLDFPNVTLVGVILADTSLHIPDFRSAERTFNILTQVAGRSGRGDKKGKVIIQTYSPNHYAIECAKNHDYIDFYEQEIIKREALRYPPFSRLTRIVVRGEDERSVEIDALNISDLASVMLYTSNNSIEVLGAAPCVMSKLKKYYRWNILIKSQNHKMLKAFFDTLKKSFTAKKGNYIEIDIDPINMV